MSRTLMAGRAFVRDHPFITILAVAIAVRIVLMPLLTYDYDIYHWGLIIENIQSGNGLYDTAGYYYTPVWGYILGSMSYIMDSLLSIDTFGVHFTELIPVENLSYRFHIATITTIEFNVFIKAFLVITDIAVALLLYNLTEERTHDGIKALTAAEIWLFSLPVIYMSAIQAQFDSMSALLLLMTVYLVYHDRTFLGGMMFATAVLLKFFPAFCILVFIGYLYVKHKDDGLAMRKIASAAIGAGLMTLILIMPQILDGTWSDALSFITGRMGGDEALPVIIWKYLGTAIMIAGMIWCGIRMFRTEENIDDSFFGYTLIALALSILTSLAPQYMIVFLPILAMIIAEGRQDLYRSWFLMTFGAFFAALSLNNMSLLLSLSEFSDLISPDWVVSSMEWMESIRIGGVTSVEIMNAVGVTIQMIGLISMIFIFFRESIPKHPKLLDRTLQWMSGKYE